MIKAFLWSWILYWTLVLILPVHSIYPAATEAFLLQVLFVIVVVAAYFGARMAVRRGPMPSHLVIEVPAVGRIVRMSIILSIVGLLFLIYDKVVVQGIDYSEGLAVAREQWRVLGEDREGGASSIWSALGYVIGSCYYVTFILLIAQAHQFRPGRRLALAAAVFIFALANSVITGGRSNFMLLATMGIAAASARRDISIAAIFPSRRQRQIIGLGLILTLAYLVYVFYARAEASDELVYFYVQNFLPYMGLDFDNWYADNFSEGWIGTAGNMAILVVGYLTHSLSTFAAIIDAPPEGKVILFNNVASILYKIGFVARPDNDWFLVGRFPSVPGALWHQFGVFGFFLGAVVLGLAAAVVTTWVSRSPRRFLPLGIFAMTGSTLILSPYVFGPDFLSFPFVASAFVILAAVGRIARVRNFAPRS